MCVGGSECLLSLIDGPKPADDFDIGGGSDFLGAGHWIQKTNNKIEINNQVFYVKNIKIRRVKKVGPLY